MAFSPSSFEKPVKTTVLPMRPSLVIGVLSMLLGIQPVTTDLYLPALPALTTGLGASMAQAQLTLGALLLAFGCSQLIWGPLSDRFGRRPVLLCGLALYSLASFACLFVPSIGWLIAGRALQGAAMGAAVMCARAIVRDLYAPAEGARVMSKGLSGLGLIACASAPLGGLLADWLGWRAALAAVAVFGSATLLLVFWRFTETAQRLNTAALKPTVLLATWQRIFRHPAFLAYSALSAACYGGLFTFLATSSFVFMDVLGNSRTHYGLVMFSMCLAYLAGTFACRRLLQRFSVKKTVAIAAIFSLSGGVLMAVATWLGWHGNAALLLPFYLFMLGHGIHQPCSQSGAVGPFPHAAGAASALNGFITMLVAFGVGLWLGGHMDGTVRPLTYGVGLWSVVIAGVAWGLVRRYGDAVPGIPVVSQR